VTTSLFVPGRIEVLGKHTDYAGGSSLLIAVDRGFTFAAERTGEDNIVIVADESGDEARWRIRRAAHDAGVVSLPPASGNRPSWARYADGVLHRLMADFGDAVCGARLAFRSTLPVAAGLSSSSALVTGVFLGIDATCGISRSASFRGAISDREALATWLSAAEMGGPVGTRGGSEDHTAILCAEAGRVIRYGLAPVRHRGSAPVPAGWTFAVAASGVVADKGGAVQLHYNRLSDAAHAAARAWAAATGADAPSLGRALECAGDAAALLDAVRAGAPALGLDPRPLVRRAQHFLHECALVDAAFHALQRADVTTFGEAVNQSARIGADLLENQVPETLALTELARELGSPAASPFGAGFGGSVWALVREADADAFLVTWRHRYLAAFPDRADAELFTTPAAAPASVVMAHAG
jgi:galactokinase